MKLIYFISIILVCFSSNTVKGQTLHYKFDFVSHKTGFISVDQNSEYGNDSFYGYDLNTSHLPLPYAPTKGVVKIGIQRVISL